MQRSARTASPTRSGRCALGLALLLWLAALVTLGGCASAPPGAPGPASQYRVAPADAPLSQLVAQAGAPEGRSAFLPLLQSSAALRARLALIARAQVGLDVQTYLLGDDATGHQLMRALRDAAARGVRVRLLVDDFYTTGQTDLLLGLAAHPNVELRLYNPFPAGRDSVLLRLASLLGDFGRLNRRMHNKLFVADGRLAIAGGRNLADAYFMRSDEGNFIDFDLLCTGQVVPELAGHFDAFWNSAHAVPVQALADNTLDAEHRRASFEALTRRRAATLRPPPTLPGTGGAPDATDAWLAPPSTLAGPAGPGAGAAGWVVADAQVYFDSPDKTAGRSGVGPLAQVSRVLEQAHERVVIVSPYFLPSADGLKRMQLARERGVTVQVVTNSLVDSDEPLVSVAYGRRRMALLKAGVRLFELSSQRLHRRESLRQVLGGSVGRLHAKLGFIDNRWLLVGSMNLDPRSASTNTELALAIDSPELTRQVLATLEPDQGNGLYEVQLAADGQALEWVASDAQGDERLPEEPSPPWWQRLRLWLLSQLVPDDLL